MTSHRDEDQLEGLPDALPESHQAPLPADGLAETADRTQHDEQATSPDDDSSAEANGIDLFPTDAADAEAPAPEDAASRPKQAEFDFPAASPGASRAEVDASVPMSADEPVDGPQPWAEPIPDQAPVESATAGATPDDHRVEEPTFAEAEAEADRATVATGLEQAEAEGVATKAERDAAPAPPERVDAAAETPRADDGAPESGDSWMATPPAAIQPPADARPPIDEDARIDKPSYQGEVVFLCVVVVLMLFFSLAGVPGEPEKVVSDGSDALRKGWIEERLLEYYRGHPGEGEAVIVNEGTPTEEQATAVIEGTWLEQALREQAEAEGAQQQDAQAPAGEAPPDEGEPPRR